MDISNKNPVNNYKMNIRNCYHGRVELFFTKIIILTFIYPFCWCVTFETPSQWQVENTKMEQENVVEENEFVYPLLLMPKKCTPLETECETAGNVLLDLNISSPDLEGNDMCIYSGYCNVQLIDTYNENEKEKDLTPDSKYEYVDNDQIPVAVSEPLNHAANPSYNQSQVWIDPIRSPLVYNHYDATEPQELYSIYHQTHTSHITVEQHNTYITHNDYSSEETARYTPVDEEHKKFRKIQISETTQQINLEQNNYNFYEEDEFECGVFLSQLPEEIMNEKESKAREERRYIGLESENGALKQLMSTDIQSVSKQRKTILFLGHNSQCGQTIQKISVSDPSLKCSSGGEIDTKVVFEEPNQLNQKKYQCDKCKQIFDQMTAFKQHMVGNHKSPNPFKFYDLNSKQGDVKFVCTKCGKNLKSQEKFEIHCMGHGNPDLECSQCKKVFASKFTLRTHRKIHTRRYSCSYCMKTYSDPDELTSHNAKVHLICYYCGYTGKTYPDLVLHQREHSRDPIDAEYSESCIEDVVSETDIITTEELPNDKYTMPKEDEIEEANSIIAKVMTNKIFLLKSPKRHRRYNKACEVCMKTFDRIGDLKRHLIEHVIRSTLAKTPVSKDGTLKIHCEVCRVETFTKIDRYKAHLREHARLTLYKCTFCDKSFSDSSNFSKHKKIHGTTYFQCDLCQRKFNSKKMITQHMEYHNKNSPIPCRYCDKVFHFESMLNKHVKTAHTKELCAKFRCRFCHMYFKSLKEKWDHEWSVHNVRKMIVDCLICGSKFRKYSELKRHCIQVHDMEIPPAKKLLNTDAVK